ncbi:MAG: class D beta-lactamase [Maribacter dokdonensis]
MKLHLLLFLFICFTSCKQQKKTEEEATVERNINKIKKSEIQTIIDKADTNGSIVIYNLTKDTYYSNNFDWALQGKLPASTFKITNTIIGLETGVIESDSTIFRWDGEQKWLDLWEQDLVLRDAFQFSCVPCYQSVASKIGPQQMNQYVNKLQYGNLKIDESNITDFWLEAESRINQMQQIDFLKRFYTNKLPISKRTTKIVKTILLIDENIAFTLSGKTGLSIANNQYNGWFVGYIEVGNDVYFFATNLEPKSDTINIQEFNAIRKEATISALKTINAIS